MSTTTTNFNNLSYEDLENVSKEELVEVLNHFGVNAKSGWPKEALVDMASSRIAEAKAEAKAQKAEAKSAKSAKSGKSAKSDTRSAAKKEVDRLVEDSWGNNDRRVAAVVNAPWVDNDTVKEVAGVTDTAHCPLIKKTIFHMWKMGYLKKEYAARIEWVMDEE